MADPVGSFESVRRSIGGEVEEASGNDKGEEDWAQQFHGVKDLPNRLAGSKEILNQRALTASG
jgi:hypothetical protein